MRWPAQGDVPERLRLFRVDVDPAARHDLAQDDPARLQGPLRQLEACREDHRAVSESLPSSGGPKRRELTPSEIERLRELGYLRH